MAGGHDQMDMMEEDARRTRWRTSPISGLGLRLAASPLIYDAVKTETVPERGNRRSPSRWGSSPHGGRASASPINVAFGYPPRTKPRALGRLGSVCRLAGSWNSGGTKLLRLLQLTPWRAEPMLGAASPTPDPRSVIF